MVLVFYFRITLELKIQLNNYDRILLLYLKMGQEMCCATDEAK